jgi:hypothetical protein
MINIVYIDLLLALDQVLRKPWSGLDHFWTSMGWLKMECPCRAEIMDITCFVGYVDPKRGSLRFLQWVKGCRPMGSPMIRNFCKSINKCKMYRREK